MTKKWTIVFFTERQHNLLYRSPVLFIVAWCLFVCKIFSRQYLSDDRAISMVVVRLSVRLSVRLLRMYCG